MTTRRRYPLLNAPSAYPALAPPNRTNLFTRRTDHGVRIDADALAVQLEARLVRLRFPDYCFVCAKELERGDHVWWDDQRRFATCPACLSVDADGEGTDEPPDLLSPLGWAHDVLKYEEKRAQRDEEQHSLEKSGRLGSQIWDISAERRADTIWRDGSGEGHRTVGRMLDQLVSKGVVVLHDVRMRAERRHIDHVVVVRSGVHIIDSEQHVSKRIRVKRSGPLLARETRLFVAGRDHTALAAQMDYQVAKVQDLIGDTFAATVTQVTPVLCFVHARWGWPPRRLAIGDIEVLWPKALMTLLGRPGPLRRGHIEELGGRVASRLAYGRV
jgi:hypothetical protein